jgi:hypothetical protein
VDTFSSSEALRGVSQEEMDKFYGAHFRGLVSESLSVARLDYETRAASGLLQTVAEAPVFQELTRSKTEFQVRGIARRGF